MEMSLENEEPHKVSRPNVRPRRQPMMTPQAARKPPLASRHRPISNRATRSAQARKASGPARTKQSRCIRIVRSKGKFYGSVVGLSPANAGPARGFQPRQPEHDAWLRSGTAVIDSFAAYCAAQSTVSPAGRRMH